MAADTATVITDTMVVTVVTVVTRAIVLRMVAIMVLLMLLRLASRPVLQALTVLICPITFRRLRQLPGNNGKQTSSFTLRYD